MAVEFLNYKPIRLLQSELFKNSDKKQTAFLNRAYDLFFPTFQADMDSEASFQNRNEEMKSRIAELLTTLEKVKRNSELRQQHAEDVISDLKKNNE